MDRYSQDQMARIGETVRRCSEYYAEHFFLEYHRERFKGKSDEEKDIFLLTAASNSWLRGFRMALELCQKTQENTNLPSTLTEGIDAYISRMTEVPLQDIKNTEINALCTLLRTLFEESSLQMFEDALRAYTEGEDDD
jgi:hypothetical protein